MSAQYNTQHPDLNAAEHQRTGGLAGSNNLNNGASGYDQSNAGLNNTSNNLNQDGTQQSGVKGLINKVKAHLPGHHDTNTNVTDHSSLNNQQNNQHLGNQHLGNQQYQGTYAPNGIDSGNQGAQGNHVNLPGSHPENVVNQAGVHSQFQGQQHNLHNNPAVNDLQQSNPLHGGDRHHHNVNAQNLDTNYQTPTDNSNANHVNGGLSGFSNEGHHHHHSQNSEHFDNAALHQQQQQQGGAYDNAAFQNEQRR
ncbi:hypothetical protein HKX48_005712 [Thoreauomyces humboldtii]|nr:hypothetical protein HKX48_005712 [Thoreauomyces humboldtii]